MNADVLLRVEGLSKTYPSRRSGGPAGQPGAIKAVDGIDFHLATGETLGLVGESGCGKSTAARLVMRLVEPTQGRILLRGIDLAGLSQERLRAVRRDMQMVFQDPLSSLNPRMTVGTSIMEPMRFHDVGSIKDRIDMARQMLSVVGLQPQDFDRYPHEFSGGQCQRIAIARALVLRPKLVIFDEPVSALDVSVRAQIIKLMLDLQQEFSLTYMFISHDLSVVKRISDRIAVMYLGKIVELAPAEEIYRWPQHPYTRSLIDAIPLPDPRLKRIDDYALLEGDLPSAGNLPAGCRFSGRCPRRTARCMVEEPGETISGTSHLFRCFEPMGQLVPEVDTATLSSARPTQMA